MGVSLPAGFNEPRAARRLSLLLSALILAACSSSTNTDARLWEGTLSPSAASGMQGSVAAVSQFGRTLLSIEVHQGEAESRYAWRVQSGTCQVPLTVQGGAALYPELLTDETGSDSQDATLPVTLKSGASYAAQVFRMTQEGGEEILACGELEER